MADDNGLKLAKEAYETLCNTLDARDWKYEKNDENLEIIFVVNGDDIPMKFIINVDPDRQLIIMLSPLSFNMSKEKLIDGAIAVSYINYSLADGSFDYNIYDGSIFFRMTSSFMESLIGDELFKYMIDLSCMVVDEFNDQLLMINKGKLSIKDFVKENFDA